MKDQFLTWQFAIEIIIALVIALVIRIAANYYNKNVPAKDMKVDYFRIPTNNALIVLGLLVPILVALASYLYVNNPSGNYSLLLSTIVLMFAVLFIAIWETFALLKKAQCGDIINIKMPDDINYIFGMGCMYAFLTTGLIYFFIFFIFEMSSQNKSKNKETISSSCTHYLLKPNVIINQSKEAIMKSWGQPVSEDLRGGILIYESEHSLLQLSFDKNEKLKEITEKRRGL